MQELDVLIQRYEMGGSNARNDSAVLTGTAGFNEGIVDRAAQTVICLARLRADVELVAGERAHVVLCCSSGPMSRKRQGDKQRATRRQRRNFISA